MRGYFRLESLLIATHLYKSPIFKIHLWTKRDIPQPQLYVLIFICNFNDDQF